VDVDVVSIMTGRLLLDASCELDADVEVEVVDAGIVESSIDSYRLPCAWLLLPMQLVVVFVSLSLCSSFSGLRVEVYYCGPVLVFFLHNIIFVSRFRSGDIFPTRCLFEVAKFHFV